jgi:putative nucleotidyltransferase with HDIG domain
MFIVCALVPIGALALVSFTHVSGQLSEQSRARLAQASKAQGMSIYERLRYADAELKMISASLENGARETESVRPDPELPQDVGDRFDGLAIFAGDAVARTLVGEVCCPPAPTASERHHLSEGKSVVSTQAAGAGVRVFMSRTVVAPDPDVRLVGQLSPTYLWGLDGLPALTEFAVLGGDGSALVTSRPSGNRLVDLVSSSAGRSDSRQFEWSDAEEAYLASFWTLFLKPEFHVSAWTVVLSEARRTVLAPMANFRTTFGLIVLMSIWVVLLLSLVQIRRNLVPLEALREGTRRIGEQDFNARVSVDSGDEFEELAASFNSMVGRLGRQFHALTTIKEIDRAILSKWKTADIAETVLARMPQLVACDGVAVALLDDGESRGARVHVGGSHRRGPRRVEPVTLSAEEIQTLREHDESLVVSGEPTPSYLAPLAAQGLKEFLALPIFLREELSGIVCIGRRQPFNGSRDDVLDARQVADQVAVALSNARLVEELDRFNWGTLHALARAIDAKSSWTAGHSERVTDLAVRIGQALRLPQAELAALHRGGLLHDLGKIGIPADVLDKPARLTDEEFAVMRDHVKIGARILEPLAAFADVLPIVLEHHEWYDGSGYPKGLAGDQLSLGGRIFAVADVYDALTSERPYRTALSHEQAVDLITRSSGRQFDPKVVSVFLEVMAPPCYSSGSPVQPGLDSDGAPPPSGA